jgi:AcrR family transcriptional regulator
MTVSIQPTPAEARRQKQREEARRAILDATEALLIEAGGDDFSIRTLADRCGYTPPTIYHYFSDKAGLLDALLEERFARLLASVEDIPHSDDAVENLRRMVEAFVDFGRKNPAFYRLIVVGPRAGGERTPPSVEAAREVLSAPWVELHQAGRLYGSDPNTAAQSMWAVMHGLTALQISRPDFDWAPDVAEVAVDSMLRGLIRSGASGSDS